MNFPFRVSAADSISEAVLHIFDPVPCGKGIAHEADPALAGLDFKRVVEVVSEASGIELPMALEPALTHLGVAQAVRCVSKEPIIDLAHHRRKREQEEQHEQVP